MEISFVLDWASLITGAVFGALITAAGFFAAAYGQYKKMNGGGKRK